MSSSFAPELLPRPRSAPLLGGPLDLLSPSSPEQAPVVCLRIKVQEPEICENRVKSAVEIALATSDYGSLERIPIGKLPLITREISDSMGNCREMLERLLKGSEDFKTEGLSPPELNDLRDEAEDLVEMIARKIQALQAMQGWIRSLALD